MIKENLPLAPLTTFRVGGPARYFTETTGIEEIKDALSFARGKNLPFFILGGGSNILVSDSGFPGLVIKISLRGISHEEDGKEILVTAAAGEDWDGLVAYAVERGWRGIENLSGVPGTVGAAPIQNIGCYGMEVKNSIESVLALKTDNGELVNFTKKECGFSYRESFFKKDEGRKYIIVSVLFRLSPDAPLVFGYRDIADYFAAARVEESSVSLSQMREAILKIRDRKLPALDKYGTAGSFFKNPVVSEDTAHRLSEKYPDLPKYGHLPGFVKLPAAYLIDRVAGLRAVRRGNVGTYENQALVLANYGGAKAADLISLAEEITVAVEDKTGVRLEPEVSLVGEFP